MYITFYLPEGRWLAIRVLTRTDVGRMVDVDGDQCVCTKQNLTKQATFVLWCTALDVSNVWLSVLCVNIFYIYFLTLYILLSILLDHANW